jgi:nucleotide-binding universal stress UspA family protein
MENAVMWKNILVPTDFGEPAEHALDIGLELGRKFDARLTLVHVYQLFIAMPYTDALSYPFEEIERNARKLLDASLAKAQARYPRCEGVLQVGFAADEIVATARSVNADLIVMGTHRRRGLPRMVMGSVAERVLRTSPIPVLAVGAQD